MVVTASQRPCKLPRGIFLCVRAAAIWRLMAEVEGSVLRHAAPVARTQPRLAACEWGGLEVVRGVRTYLDLRFRTYSLTWDGQIDEVYLADKIARGRHAYYDLSDPSSLELREVLSATWSRVEDEQPEPRPAWSKRMLVSALLAVAYGIPPLIGWVIAALFE
jgi:hypothetical protein